MRLTPVALGRTARRRPFSRLLVLILLLLTLSAAHTTTNAANIPISPNTTVNYFQHLSKSYLSVNADPTKPFIDAKAAVLIDGANGNILYQLDGDTPRPIGSTTKMVSALVARQLFISEAALTVSEHAANINGSTVGLKTGEKLALPELLKALLIPSGNDAAYTLAEAYSGQDGNFQPFVSEMNKFASTHHLKHTQFQDPAGLEDTGYSSAIDLAQIGRLLLNDPLLAMIVHQSQATVTTASGRQIAIKNTDQLLQSGTTAYYNPEAIGIKTGFTPLAGYCLVAAENFHGHLLIAVVLGVPGNGETASAKEINKLFTWAGQNVTVQTY